MNLTIIENHSELGAGTRGASLGIDAIKAVAWQKGSSLFNESRFIRIDNHNQVLRNIDNNPFAKRIDSIEKIYESVSQSIYEVAKINKNFPVVLSGDHSSAGGTIAGLKKAFPDSKLGVIWIDAHADMHSPFTTPSGNVHGMPLAAAMGKDNISCKRNDPDQKVMYSWQKLKHIGGKCPKILPEDIVLFGVRDIEPEEAYLIDHYNIRHISVAEIGSKGAQAVTNEALYSNLKDCDYIYVSFDVDALDCEMVSRGTGTPVPGGLKISDVEQIISTVFASKKVICMEITEVNPLLDNKGNAMAETALSILEKVIPKTLNSDRMACIQ